MAAYGEVDELNATLGTVRAELGASDTARLLLGVQRDLFAIGAQLADPGGRVASKRAKAAVPASRVRRLEKAIDSRDAKLPPLKAFLLPGGTRASALLQLSRAVCRRAERSVVSLSHESEVDPRFVVYLNRLSDLLFVLARLENHRAGVAEDRW